MRYVTDAERRARLGRRHALAELAPTPEEAARAVVGLHGTDPAAVHLQVRARSTAGGVADVERALYADRSLVRMLGMRRTMWVVPRELVPVVQRAATDAVARTIGARYTTLLEAAGVGDATWLATAADEAAAAVAGGSGLTGAQVSAAVPRLRTPLTTAPGKPYEARVNPTTWVLTLLGAEGRIVRGRPRGSWTSSTYTWWAPEAWLGALPPAVDAGAARAELVRRWLRASGPAPVSDLRWWTGWTARDTAAALAAVPTTEVELESGRTGLLLADDLEVEPEPPPWTALLPALDATVMGWQDRGWYLGPHSSALFDRNGNAGPTVWADGRVVGGWGQRADGGVAWRLLEDVGAQTRDAVAAQAARLEEQLGGVRVTPRFRTPLERGLAAT